MDRQRLVTLLMVVLFTTLLGGYLYAGILDPTKAQWLLEERDTLQHFLGWHYFRHETWGWPLGALHSYGSEVRSSIVFTDSLPLVAIPLKLIEVWLPDPFQYQGIAALGHIVLNGAAACLLLTRLRLPMLAAIAFSVIIAAMPAVVFRGPGGAGHESLMAHWVLLLAFYLVLFRPDVTAKACLQWFLLLVVAVLVHFYLFLLAGACWAVWWLLMTLKSYRQIPAIANQRWWWGWALYSLCQPLAVLCVMWAVGYLYNSGEAPGASGFGLYLGELFGYFNSYSYLPDMDDASQLLPGWKYRISGQYEGMSYVGLGVLALWALALALGLSVHRSVRLSAAYRWQIAGLVSLSIGLFIFALSDTLIIGRYTFELPIPWPDPLRTLMRASGRLVWPLMYLSVLGAIALLAYRLKPKSLSIIAVAMLVLQGWDLSSWHHHFHAYSRQAGAYVFETDPRFDGWQTPRLQEALKSHTALNLTYADDIVGVLPLAWLAGQYQMEINVAYVARITVPIIHKAVAPAQRALLSGQPDPAVIYALVEPGMVQRACIQLDMQCVTTALATFAWQSSSKEAP